MSVIYGTREVATIGPRKHITITYPLPQETLLGSPVALPLSEPGSPQIVFTIGAGDMPALTGMPAADARYSGLFYVGGHNPTGVLHPISCAIYLNGDAWTNETLEPDPTHQAWMATFYPFEAGDPSIVVGDTIGFALWSDDAAIDYQYFALALFPTQLQAVAPDTVVLDVAFGGIVQLPTLTTPNVIVNSGNFTNATSIGFPRSTDSSGVPCLIIDPDLPLYQAERGDAQSGVDTLCLDDTFFNYNVNYMPTDLTFYVTSLRVAA